MNSTHMLVGLGSAASQISHSSQSMRRNTEYQQQTKQNNIKLYSWKISQWGNQIKSQEIEVNTSESIINVMQVIMSP